MDIDRSELSSSSSLSHSNNDIGVGNDVRVENFNNNNSAVMARTTIMTNTIATATTSTGPEVVPVQHNGDVAHATGARPTHGGQGRQ